jgi:hypothetical protein
VKKKNITIVAKVVVNERKFHRQKDKHTAGSSSSIGQSEFDFLSRTIFLVVFTIFKGRIST